MSRYNRTNEAPPPPAITAPIRYDVVDVVALQNITVLTGRNQLLSTNSVLGNFSSVVGSSIVACLAIIPGLSDVATNMATISTAVEGLIIGAEDARDAQQTQSSTISGFRTIIDEQTDAISTFANIDAFIVIEASTLMAIESTTAMQISGIRDIFTAVDISTISTTIAATSIIFQEISTTVTYINALTSSLVVEVIGQSAAISTLSADAVALASTKATAEDFIDLSTTVAVASTSLGRIGEGSTANTLLIVDLSTTLTNLSSVITIGVSIAGLSTQIGTASTGLGHIRSSYSSTAVNLSTLSSAVQQISSIFGSGNISLTEFEGLSTAVLTNSSAIGRILPTICSVTVELSSLSTMVQGVSTSIGTVGGFLALTDFEGLSTYVLGQSSAISHVGASLCSFIAGISSLSSAATTLSTGIGNTANYVSFAEFDGLSTTVLDQSSAIMAISDSLSGFIINLSSLSSTVASVSSALGFDGYARISQFNGLSTTVANQSINISIISIGAAIAVATYSSVSTVANYMSTATNTFTIGNSTLQYGLGNTMFTGSTLAGGTANSVSTGVEVAIGFSNSVSSGVGTAIGFCNAVVGVQTAMAIGSYAAPRVAAALAIAGGYTSSLNNQIVGGSPQTLMVNTFGRTTAADTYAPLVYWANTAASTNSNLALSVVSSNFLMHSVSLDLQGYEGDGGGSAGGGFYRGAFQFFTYWDNTSARNIYICDGVTGASSTLSTTLTPAFITNRLTGAPVVTATVFASTVTSNVAGNYAVAVKSSAATATNWLARLTVGELASMGIPEPIWGMFRNKPTLTGFTDFIGPNINVNLLWTFSLSSSNFVIGSPAIDSQNNIYIADRNTLRSFTSNGTLRWSRLASVGNEMNAPAFVTDTRIVVVGGGGSSANRCQLINTSTGVPIGSTRLFATVGSFYPPVTFLGDIYLASRLSIGLQSNLITSLNSNLSTNWTVTTLSNNYAPATDGIRLYTTNWDGTVYARSLVDGSIIWQSIFLGMTSNALAGNTYAGLSPSIDSNNSILYCPIEPTGSTGGIAALNATTGAVLWLNIYTIAIPQCSPTIGSTGIVYTTASLSDPNQGMRAFDSNGNLLWSNAINDVRSITVDTNNVLFCGTINSFSAINGLTGNILWNYTTSGSTRNTTVCIGSNRTIYAQSDDRNLYALITI